MEEFIGILLNNYGYVCIGKAGTSFLYGKPGKHNTHGDKTVRCIEFGGCQKRLTDRDWMEILEIVSGVQKGLYLDDLELKIIYERNILTPRIIIEIKPIPFVAERVLDKFVQSVVAYLKRETDTEPIY